MSQAGGGPCTALPAAPPDPSRPLDEPAYKQAWQMMQQHHQQLDAAQRRAPAGGEARKAAPAGAAQPPDTAAQPDSARSRSISGSGAPAAAALGPMSPVLEPLAGQPADPSPLAAGRGGPPLAALAAAAVLPSAGASGELTSADATVQLTTGGARFKEAQLLQLAAAQLGDAPAGGRGHDAPAPDQGQPPPAQHHAEQPPALAAARAGGEAPAPAAAEPAAADAPAPSDAPAGDAAPPPEPVLLQWQHRDAAAAAQGPSLLDVAFALQGRIYAGTAAEQGLCLLGALPAPYGLSQNNAQGLLPPIAGAAQQLMSGRSCMLCGRDGEPLAPHEQHPSAMSASELGALMPVMLPAAAGQLPQVVWAHRQCVLWSPEVLPSATGELDPAHVTAAIVRGLRTPCSRCAAPGATLNCWHQHCGQHFHLPCARAQGCHLVPEPYTVACAAHDPSLMEQEDRFAAQPPAQGAAQQPPPTTAPAPLGSKARRQASGKRRARLEADGLRCNEQLAPLQAAGAPGSGSVRRPGGGGDDAEAVEAAALLSGLHRVTMDGSRGSGGQHGGSGSGSGHHHGVASSAVHSGDVSSHRGGGGARRRRSSDGGGSHSGSEDAPMSSHGHNTRAGRHGGTKADYARMARGDPLPPERPSVVVGTKRPASAGAAYLAAGPAKHPRAAGAQHASPRLRGAGATQLPALFLDPSAAAAALEPRQSATGEARRPAPRPGAPPAADGRDQRDGGGAALAVQALPHPTELPASLAAALGGKLPAHASEEEVLEQLDHVYLGGTTGQAGRPGRCAICVVQRKGKCGADSAPKKCFKRRLLNAFQDGGWREAEAAMEQLRAEVASGVLVA